MTGLMPSQTIALAEIEVGQRVRPIDDERAKMLAASIEQEGLIHPISVRFTPNGTRKYRLVAGGHRLRAFEMLEREAIAVTPFKGDAKAAKRAEFMENLARNELTVLERAKGVAEYRQDWEWEHGAIRRGKPMASNSVNLTELAATGSFADHVAEQLMCSRSAIERLTLIAKKLPADLCERLHGTWIANHQASLLKLAKVPADKLAKAAQVFDFVEGDFEKLMDALGDPKPKQSEAMKLFSRAIDTWSRMRPMGRLDFVRQHRAEIEKALAQLDGEDDRRTAGKDAPS